MLDERKYLAKQYQEESLSQHQQQNTSTKLKYLTKFKIISVKPSLFSNMFYLFILLIFVQSLNALPLAHNTDESTSIQLPKSDETNIINNNLPLETIKLSDLNKSAIKIDENTILFENLADSNVDNTNNFNTKKFSKKNELKKNRKLNNNHHNSDNIDTDKDDAYFNYILKASSRLYSNKKGARIPINPNHPSNQFKKIFKADKTLQRLEKKSWKIPMKSVALYSESSKDSQAPQKMIGELQDLFDTFKDS